MTNSVIWKKKKRERERENSQLTNIWNQKEKIHWEFSGSPEVRTPCSSLPRAWA